MKKKTRARRRGLGDCQSCLGWSRLAGGATALKRSGQVYGLFAMMEPARERKVGCLPGQAEIEYRKVSSLGQLIGETRERLSCFPQGESPLTGPPTALRGVVGLLTKDKFQGALLGTLVGDALGMAVEGWDRERIIARYGAIKEMRPGHLPAGSYTDDTEMMIAVAESLIRCRGFDPADMVNSFLANCHPYRGYSSRGF